jgi:hypothetical protein
MNAARATSALATPPNLISAFAVEVFVRVDARCDRPAFRSPSLAPTMTPLRCVAGSAGVNADVDAVAVDRMSVRAAPAAALTGDAVPEGDGGACVARATAAAVGVAIADAVAGLGGGVVIGIGSLTEVAAGSGVRVGGVGGVGVAVDGGQITPGWPGTAPLLNPPGPHAHPSMSPSCTVRAPAPTGEYCHALSDQW